MTLSADTASWPGDTPFHYEISWSMEESGSVNVGKIETSTHIGTHIDAPYHYDAGGKKVEELSLERYVSRAIVIDCSNKEKIEVEDILPSLKTPAVQTVLLKTDYWRDRNTFPESIPTMDEKVPKELKKKGIKLIGVDLPSVDSIDSKDLPIHRTLLENDIWILEGIVLKDIAEGEYELIALPLKLKDADGSPVRAILREI
ncbi:arylformamidase [Jeotgalibacillus proteolyticus]|uniref:Arylformamidase n=2 Tax=Jeotgalibacillus proteolyticus TaxID=2082395 RepID=A0A2S5GHH9_9BACL|nr:arylformamidase [Jeotgalibacillus proteolyticus]